MEVPDIRYAPDGEVLRKVDLIWHAGCDYLGLEGERGPGRAVGGEGGHLVVHRHRQHPIRWQKLTHNQVG
jgi:hypothetical protein